MSKMPGNVAVATVRIFYEIWRSHSQKSEIAAEMGFWNHLVGVMDSKNKKKQIIVAVSGGFDPIHAGHVRLFQEAKKLGDKLVVILNNDNWLKKKKGYVFMREDERKEVIAALTAVDEVILSGHGANAEDMSVNAELKKLRPHIFANGGDRTVNNIPEVAVCNQLKCKMIFNAGRGGKIQSSSWLVSDRSK